MRILQVGTTTWPFAYEAAIGAGTLATTAAVFYQTPSLKSARALFQFSLAFLPAFMLGLVVHRVPNDHSVTFVTLKEKLYQEPLFFSRSSETLAEFGEEYWTNQPHRKYPDVPIPFLPPPLRYRCPAKIACEGSEQAELDKVNSRGSQRQGD